MFTFPEINKRNPTIHKRKQEDSTLIDSRGRTKNNLCDLILIIF